MAAAVAATAVFGATPAGAQADRARALRAPSRREANRDTSARDVIIPFTVGPSDCGGRTQVYAVTMRIYNVLAQVVGVPTLALTDASGAVTGAAGRPLTRLMLPCGRYVAYWNGKHVATGLRLPPGVYLYDLVIDGQRITRKITLGR